MAPQAGIEPATCCLEGSCSVQLSYWGVKDGGDSRPCRARVQAKTAQRGTRSVFGVCREAVSAAAEGTSRRRLMGRVGFASRCAPIGPLATPRDPRARCATAEARLPRGVEAPLRAHGFRPATRREPKRAPWTRRRCRNPEDRLPSAVARVCVRIVTWFRKRDSCEHPQGEHSRFPDFKFNPSFEASGRARRVVLYQEIKKSGRFGSTRAATRADHDQTPTNSHIHKPIHPQTHTRFPAAPGDLTG